MNIGVIGLGNMGLGIAKNLTACGESVLGFDIAPNALDKARAENVATTNSLPVLVEQSDCIVLSLPKAEHVRQLCLGSRGLADLGRPGLVVIDTSTSTADVSRMIAKQLAFKQIIFMDAPVSGGPAGAANGTMSMVVGASEEDYARALPLLQKMSGKQTRVGSTGAGNIVKIGNNLLAAAHLITTAEMVSMARRAGVEPMYFLQGLNQGSGRSAASEVNFDTWILNKAYNSGFTMALMRKDVGLAKQMMDELGMDLPLAEQVIRIWQHSINVLADGNDFNEIVKLTDAQLFS